VGHFLSIDLGFLDRATRRLFGTSVRNPVIDTFSVHEWLRLRLRLKDHPYFLPPAEKSKLYDIAKSFGVPVNGAHNALMDAYTTAQIFQRMVPMLQSAGVRDLGDLLKIGIPFEGGESAKLAGEYCNL
jgi:DNA polymerase-3 subunit epsilon